MLSSRTMFPAPNKSPHCVVAEVALSTIPSPLSPLWPPHAGSVFACPQTPDEAAQVKRWLYGLSDGQLFACRGRDYEAKQLLAALRGDGPDEPEVLPPPRLSSWEYGVGIKSNRAVYLLWGPKVEKHEIGSLDLLSLLHVGGEPVISSVDLQEAPAAAAPKRAVVILCHGFSPETGPSYPLIVILRNLLTDEGYQVIVPDFRDTYAYGAARGRSERVCLVLESVLRARSHFPDLCVVLMGHSQGGAAAAQACRRGVVADGCVRGLVMLGSESARERIEPPELLHDGARLESHVGATQVDIYSQLPPGLSSSQILMLHSSRDPVVSRLAIELLVREASEHERNF
jgi:pimeloyl-ACP methyl ester carboxylesterase